MKNLLNTQKTISAKDIKSFGVTEIFILGGELYTTSNYQLPYEMVEALEKELLTPENTGVISTGQTVEQVKDLMRGIAIEFMQMGFSQKEACKLAKEAILEGHNFLKAKGK